MKSGLRLRASVAQLHLIFYFTYAELIQSKNVHNFRSSLQEFP